MSQPKQAGKEVNNLVTSLKRGLAVLEFVALSSYDPNISQIAAGLRFNRATTYRLVNTLQVLGYLQQVNEKKGYKIGLKILPLTASSLDNSTLRLKSLPYLQKLSEESRERVNLGTMFDGEIIYLAGVEKPQLPSIYTRFGKRAPAHCCSLGKVILAYLPEEELNLYLEKHPLRKITENTITDVEYFKQHLREIRSKGYAIDNAEHIPNSYCISALINDSTGLGVGSISISSADIEKLKNQKENLKRTAEIISHLMGYTLR